MMVVKGLGAVAQLSVIHHAETARGRDAGVLGVDLVDGCSLLEVLLNTRAAQSDWATWSGRNGRVEVSMLAWPAD